MYMAYRSRTQRAQNCKPTPRSQSPACRDQASTIKDWSRLGEMHIGPRVRVGRSQQTAHACMEGYSQLNTRHVGVRSRVTRSSDSSRAAGNLNFSVKFRGLKALIHNFLNCLNFYKENTSVCWILPEATKCHLYCSLPPLGIKLCHCKTRSLLLVPVPLLGQEGMDFKPWDSVKNAQPESSHEETSDRPKLRDVLQSHWPEGECNKVKVMEKNQEAVEVLPD